MVVLDTDLIITYLRRVPRMPTVEFLARKQKAVATFNFFASQRNEGKPLQTTIFNAGELQVGVNRDPDKAKASKILSEFFKNVVILPFSMDDTIRFGKIKAQLLDMAKICGDIDILIASIVINHDETLYTNNMTHYSSIPGLNVTDWMSFQGG
jgi:predicted nucleic acid-binding protein